MAKRAWGDDLKEIERVVRYHPDGITAREIARQLPEAPPLRTLQYRLRHLVDSNRLVKHGDGRAARFRLPPIIVRGDLKSDAATLEARIDTGAPLSEAAAEVRAYVRQPLGKRRPAGYDRTFLDSYRPNVTAYLGPRERAHLHQIGKGSTSAQAAGTYAKQILDRLLIDLSWNSSRLEGNTYSLLDTKKLIDFGEQAEGKGRLEAQMILNHKDAIEFLVGSAEEIGFNRYTILNLHALLANNLLADEAAAGRLRHIAVGIDGSVFHPLEVPQLIEECFDQILTTAAAIEDPFEQSFFVMVQLPYLQPFDDVNKRVSRLAANIPFIKQNLSPLSFTEVAPPAYTEAILGVYELRRTELLKDIFIWAYERSAARYAAVRQSLGEPDAFRMRYRDSLRDLISEIIRDRMDRKETTARIVSWVDRNIDVADRARFREMAENEILGLHEGNFARYRVKPSEFEAWQRTWSRPTSGS